jgi:quercetin dioxygenase-like cupin family protein
MPDKYHLSEIQPRPMMPGGQVRLIHSQTMTLAYWEFEANTPLPEHSHPHEQVFNLLEGRFELTIDRKSQQYEAGAVVIIPGNARHSAKAITACRVLDVFHPVRADLK